MEETLLSTAHYRMHVTAPHLLLCRHPGAVRAAISFVAGEEGAKGVLERHPGYLVKGIPAEG